MRTRLEVTSSGFPPYPIEAERLGPDRFGMRLAEFLAIELVDRGFSVQGTDFEEWGVKVVLENPDFPLWIGCCNCQGVENRFLCFIEPHKPYAGSWLKRVATEPTIGALASALESILLESSRVTQLRWLDGDGG